MNQEPVQQQQFYPPEHPIEEDIISITDILIVLARNIKLIILIPSFFCTLTIINVLFITPPIYTSTASFMSSGSQNGDKFQRIH